MNYTIGGTSPGATFSSCRRWRYRLWRTWGNNPANRITWIGLNPSTGDEIENDPTIRRCIGFSQQWGYHSMDMMNAFAWRSTDPRGLLTVSDPVGDQNDEWLLRACSTARRVVLAWGSHAPIKRILVPRASAVRCLLSVCKTPVGHLGLCKDGQPRHPLYLPYETPFHPTFWTKVTEVSES